ncbi:MAG TPA: DUF423 domain-containing protein [Puia sp.]|nr:DUF423 domain-containing protein [Puia sp.]
MNKRFLITAAVFGALAVAAGAFFAHLLRQKMPPVAVEVYETAVRYQFYHVFALLACGMLAEKFAGNQIRRAGIFFTIGILLFSGSLYSISGLMTNGIPVPLILGILTPLGGLSFILGWVFLTIAISTERRS